MTILFITGLSGVGKSSVLSEMKSRGYKSVDLDYGYVHVHSQERLFNEAKIKSLINNHQDTHLILAGTESNQGEFYSEFDVIVLLTADLETMLERIEKRTGNAYGKTEKEREEVIKSNKHVLPLLKKGANVDIDTTHMRIEDVCDQIEAHLDSRSTL